MKTLGVDTCFLKLFQSEYNRVIIERGFGLKKRVRVDFSFALSSQFHHNNKCVHSISAAVSSAQTNVEIEELHTIFADESKTVRVRFKLQKECVFGQEFILVGDDPIIGLWDPSGGVTLNWSDGHVWTAELDIPSGKVIKYKFILKEGSETILWQPGPDRILQTWDTENTITVYEDWDNPELQKIVEGELEADLNEEILISVVDEGTENVIEELGERDMSESDAMSASNLLSLEEERRLASDEKDPVPVLVPGLIPMPPEEIEEDLLNKVEMNNPSDEDEELALPELKVDEYASASMHPKETINEENIDQKNQHYGKEQPENGIFEENLQWGRRTLQKFLANFGFQRS